MMGMLGMRVCSSPESLARLPRADTTYKPLRSREDVMAEYAGWQRALRQVMAGGER